MKYPIFILMSALSMVSCLPEEAEAVNLDEELVPYFISFSEEAAKRGIDFDWREDGVEGFIGNTSEDNILGQCVHDSSNPNSVIINHSFWNNSSNFDKEFIVFHELGHCFLNRSHFDEVDEDGVCTSIMNSGSKTCRSNYSDDTRDEYLDELFTL